MFSLQCAADNALVVRLAFDTTTAKKKKKKNPIIIALTFIRRGERRIVYTWYIWTHTTDK